MQTLDSPSLPSVSSSDVTEPKLQTPNPKPSSPSPSVIRLWRPAAQRNLRNQWSKLVPLKQQWVSASSSGRSHATFLVNAHLSERYMPAMNLGVLSDMPNIREKAIQKLAQQQKLHRVRLLSSYKDMVVVVSHMVNVSSSMRSFVKGPTSSPFVQFSSHSEENNDNGDGGGIPVFKFCSIPYFESLAKELVQMFGLELILKRMLLVELLPINCEESPQQTDALSWSNELYPGEFDDLTACNLYSEQTCEPVPPRINGWKSDDQITKRANVRPDQKALEVYLTTWLQEVKIDTLRVDEIFAIVGEEMQMRLV
ncbi:hypothetical protein BVC80_8939g16 [Macleaya cordata]|uniref:Uncharacterized protein n=1 Tax=Macleaya cordata TaxID=56857 RepID=A0A200R849_MACCD|nr:hypothetical protein BVC80_8939g16 [Macleaya cordata]